MIRKVKFYSDALQVCMAHALSTEKEEVMGLLIGEVDDENISHVHAIIMLRRLDKRKDRVEISPEQLSNASTDAENIGFSTRAQKPLRVVGWYHSHPHITVWPSHVDVKTQAMYQFMDDNFIGVIISCFITDSSTGLGQFQVTCFQSLNVGSNVNPKYERFEIEQEILPCDYISDACLEALTTLPSILCEEEKDAYSKSLEYRDQDLLTAVQNSAIFSQALIQIIEYICSPFLQSMEKQAQENSAKLEKLKKKLKSLKESKNGK